MVHCFVKSLFKKISTKTYKVIKNWQINKAKLTIHRLKKKTSQLIVLPFNFTSLFFPPQHPNRCSIKILRI